MAFAHSALAIGFLWMAVAVPVVAAPVEYRLIRGGDDVGFLFAFGGGQVRGKIPVAGAQLSLDFNDVIRSKVSVTLDAAKTRAGFAFATQAVRGPEVLDSARFPTIRFVTRQFRQTPQGAIVRGDLTIRGVTRPVSLNGRLIRAPGLAPDDNSRLTVKLTGAVQRSDFGAAGFPKLVGDRIELDISVTLQAAR